MVKCSLHLERVGGRDDQKELKPDGIDQKVMPYHIREAQHDACVVQDEHEGLVCSQHSADRFRSEEWRHSAQRLSVVQIAPLRSFGAPRGTLLCGSRKCGGQGEN